ncbi:MAG: pyrroline-5-carboxylate reductase [Planctomycetaceae bacterium]|nr:pyrroline-5-carboxylate reductase [Planctomycetaceae bacterium]
MASPTAAQTRIGFIGAGKMAGALAAGMLNGGVVKAEHLFATDVSPQASQAFAELTSGVIVPELNDLIAQSEIIFLAVKPHHLPPLLSNIKPEVNENHLVVSIAAGVSLDTLQSGLDNRGRVIRVMPNTPCLVGEGACAYCLGVNATEEDAQLLERLLSTVSLIERVDENLLDAVTGLSGSGPAYVYQFIEALSDGGVRMGLPRQIATQMAAKTVLGAAKMVLETGQHPGALKDAVTSPGGTTIAGLHALEQGGFRGIVMNAVQSATLRSQELG